MSQDTYKFATTCLLGRMDHQTRPAFCGARTGILWAAMQNLFFEYPVSSATLKLVKFIFFNMIKTNIQIKLVTSKDTNLLGMAHKMQVKEISNKYLYMFKL